MDAAAAVEWLNGLQRFGMRLGLTTTEGLLRRIGNPHEDFRSFHVTGTNAKGSVCAFAESVLRLGGVRVGRYVSPHVQSFTERITVNGVRIRPEELAAQAESIRPDVEAVAAETGVQPTFFEVTTALAFAHFAASEVDVAVVEVGLGGRLDATNVLLPEVCAVTRVGYDHTEILGTKLAEIAAEKAAIIKGGTALVGELPPEAADVVRQRCGEVGARLLALGRDFQGTVAGRVNLPIRADIRAPGQEVPNCELGIPGFGQPANAAMAVAAAGLFGELSEGAIREGLRTAFLPGRFEIVKDSPTVLLDGAHNPDAGAHLRATLEAVFPGRKVRLVLGMMRDKDAAAFLAPLRGLLSEIIVTTPRTPRASPPEELARAAESACPTVTILMDVRTAARQAILNAGPDDVVLVTGSFYTVGEARELFFPEFASI